MDKKAIIIYERYYDFDNSRILSGGVQTYISNLIPLLIESGYECQIHQCGVNNLEIYLNNCFVKCYSNTIKSGKYDTHSVLSYAMRSFDLDNDLLIFGDHLLAEKNKAKNSISIQHGIHWDIPKEYSRNRLRMCFSKALFSYREQRRVEYVKTIVCVDYNFQNWYRTQVDNINTNLIIIPNFTRVAQISKKPDNSINIIFARRFVKYRGTRVFVEAAKMLLQKHNIITITIAGRGPDEQFMKDELSVWNDRVHFLHYNSEDSLLIHADKHIAVVPTVGSEGTSLSLLEAMSAQCAVVCSDVGGMTNIVIDGFNGKMVSAGNTMQLFKAIDYLITNPQERHRLAQMGFQTAKAAFSFDLWQDRWRRVLNNNF